MHQYATLGDTLYFWFGANDTAGSGGDGATPLADVRLGGDGAASAPTLSPTPSLLSHANYPAGCYEVSVAATSGNGFAAGNTYGVFCTLTIDSQNPTGFVGSFTLDPVPADMIELNSSTTAAINLMRGAQGLTVITVGTGSTTTVIETNLTETTNNHFNGKALTFITGALAGQSTGVTSYDGTNKRLTVVQVTDAAANGDIAVLS